MSTRWNGTHTQNTIPSLAQNLHGGVSGKGIFTQPVRHGKDGKDGKRKNCKEKYEQKEEKEETKKQKQMRQK